MNGARVLRIVRALALVLLATAASAQVPPGFSLTCQFTYGPKAGQIESFPQAWPVPIGSPCTDAIASSGVAIAPPAAVPPKPALAGSSAMSELRSPVSGTWGALQAPPCPNPMNHHCGTPNQQFAYDLVLLNQFGQPTSCIGQPVYSPSAGVVEYTQDGFPNHAVPGQHLAGNHVVIRRSSTEYILIAHFSPGTISVKQGNTVTVGQQLGQCGNSGQSTFPHVHMHMQSHPNPLQFNSPGQPMSFSSIGILGPGGCVQRANHVLVRGETICAK
jgi:hypothetical protein